MQTYSESTLHIIAIGIALSLAFLAATVVLLNVPA
jgi:hypothetical protein